MSVSTKSVLEIIGKLECGKSAGPDGIGAEYFKFSNIKIHTMTENTIVPIVINKSGKLSDSNNYRPINYHSGSYMPAT